MGIEEVIRKLEEMAEDREDILPGCLGWDEAEPLREAVALLKTHPDAQPNEPLTLEELLKMDGEPVWLKTLGEDFEDGWQIVVDVDKLRAHFRQFYAPTFCHDYGNTWVAYGRMPKEVRVLAVAEEKRKAHLADMQVGKTLDGVPIGVVLPKLDMESSELKEMPEYIEREATLKVITAKAEVYDVGQGDALEGLYVADREVAELPAADVVSAEEFALLEAKNEVLGQENDRLKAEIKRLHEENFWLTGGGTGYGVQ